MVLQRTVLFVTYSMALALAFAYFLCAVDSYDRPPPRKNLFVKPLDDDEESASPQQVLSASVFVLLFMFV